MLALRKGLFLPLAARHYDFYLYKAGKHLNAALPKGQLEYLDWKLTRYRYQNQGLR